jgi:hypothetical protein
MILLLLYRMHLNQMFSVLLPMQKLTANKLLQKQSKYEL